jgi:regulator of sigma E protease
MDLLIALLGLAVLMVVHEAGHFFVARAFGMRVERFAIGIGPTIWRYQPKDSPTVYQIGLIPFLAYVQIAGLNPFEEIDPDDSGSYANASLTGRISAIIAGPLANYLFASIVFFGSLVARGDYSDQPVVVVDEVLALQDGDKELEIPSPAHQAGVRTGDRILSVDGHSLSTWDEIPKYVRPKAGKSVQLLLERDGQKLELPVIPYDNKGTGIVGVHPETIPLPWGKAILPAIELPATIVGVSVVSIGKMITGQESPQLSGPLGLMRETRKAAVAGIGQYLWILGVLSTSLAFFNMLPIPALDGGRLMFLGYEGVTRRRANQKVEAQIHMVGMLMLLATLVLVTYREWGTEKAPSDLASEQRQKSNQEPAAADADRGSDKDAEPQSPGDE